jgi:hypothetical protein
LGKERTARESFHNSIVNPPSDCAFLRKMSSPDITGRKRLGRRNAARRAIPTAASAGGNFG